MEFRNSGFFLLRTPLLPFEEVSDWKSEFTHGSLTRIPVNTDDDSNLASEVSALRRHLREIVDRSEVRHALYLASQSLEASIDSWVLNPDSKKGVQTERALVRYVMRMAVRSTPFGLFSGCSVGHFTDRPRAVGDLLLSGKARHSLRIGLDYGVLFKIASDLNSDHEIAQEVKFHRNSSLHRIGDVWHFIDCDLGSASPSHSMIKLTNDPYLECALSTAKDGATASQIAKAIVSLSQNTVDLSESESFVQELIGSRVLVSSLFPTATGSDPIEHLLGTLAKIDSNHQFVRKLHSIKEGLISLEQKGLEARREDYDALADNLLPSSQMPESDSTFHVDLFKPLVSGTIHSSIADELAQAVEVLHTLGASPFDPRRKLQRFREAFRRRYGHAWVPLAEALDDDFGIGVDGAIPEGSSGLLQTLPRTVALSEPVSTLTDFHKLLLEKLVRAKRSGESQITLERAESPPIPSVHYALPDAFSITATILAPSMNAVSAGQFEILMRAGAGPSGATAMGRFCDALPELDRCVREHLDEESRLVPQAVFAEIAYLPGGRAGNILFRPVLRQYEIPYLGQSGADPQDQIPLDDLLVTVDEFDDIILFSQRLQKRVIPRLSSALTFNQTRFPPVFRFLCYLQYEPSKVVPSFDWGPLGALPFLPRVRTGKVILSPAKWNISADEALSLTGQPSREAAFWKMQELRQQRSLPRWIHLVESDHLLPIDLNNALCVDTLLHVLKRQTSAVLEEIVATSSNLLATGPEGHFHHEIVVPFIREQPLLNLISDKQAKSMAYRAKCNPHQGRTCFPPGSEWLYMKLYGGMATLDEIVVDVLPLLIQIARDQGRIDKWFFIRYADPDPHLRIRFKGDAPTLVTAILPALQAQLDDFIESKRLYRIQIDTYEPETDRYGGHDGQSIAEDVFCCDSEAVLDLLRVTKDQFRDSERWKLAFLSSHWLLSDCFHSLEPAVTILRSLRDYFDREVNADRQFKSQLATNFRQMRALLLEMTSGFSWLGEVASQVEQILKVRSTRLRPAVHALRELDRENCLSQTVNSIAGSYLHMHLNRMLRDEGRLHELVIYDHLIQIYSSLLARRADLVGQN